VLFQVASPIAPPGSHVIILKGNLSPGGSVIKLSGKDMKHFRGPARVFDDECVTPPTRHRMPSHVTTHHHMMPHAARYRHDAITRRNVPPAVCPSATFV
jgi:hypothetical protein